jgi:hypothetical protein
MLLLDRLTPFLLGIGLILSPLNLAALGNAAGTTGHYFPVVLLAVLTAHLLTTSSYRKLFSAALGDKEEAPRNTPATNPFLALVLGSRIFLALCATPLILVSAGFIFNELFLYWFPNFGFAYGLLIILLLLNLLNEKAALRTQLFLVGIAVAGIWLVATIGLGSAIFFPDSVHDPGTGSGPALPGIITIFLLFVGFDLAVVNRHHRARTFFRSSFWMAAALGVSGFTFLLWGMVSLLQVPASNLMETTVAHIVAARKILGETGARIMGVAVLAGAGAAVNALLFSIPRLLAGLPGGKNKSASNRRENKTRAISLILLGGGQALVLALGLAGDPELEVALKAGLLLWSTQYAFVHFRALIENGLDRTKTVFSRAVPLTGLVLCIGVLAGITLGENRTSLLISLFLAFLLISWFLYLILSKYQIE